MRFTLATVIAALPLFIAVAPQRVKQGGTAIPLSRRLSLVNADKSVNFEVLNFHIASTTAKILRGFDSFGKNTGAPHPSAVKGARKRASGGLALDPFDVGPHIWFGTVSVGTPPAFYTVLFDTGSSDFVLPGVDCDDSCNGHAIYDPASSLTSNDMVEFFFMEYGRDDGAFGRQYTDNVTIVGLTATDQTLGVASHYSEGFEIEQFSADGVIGMAFQSISEYDQSPVFQTLVVQGQTDEPVFGFSFAASGPELYLGGTNPAMYAGDFTYTHVTQVGFWQVNIDNVVGNEQIALTNVAAVIDTGSDLIHGNPSDVATLYEAIGGTVVLADERFYTFPCDAVPTVSLTFGGTSFSIPTETFNIGLIDSPSSDCIGAIIAGDTPIWIIGTIFLSNVYTSFDLANVRVGFAMLA
ncbi:acid protease [Gyrodon lividus]|nr:acid protease [Gyrodon lividus]